MIMGEAVRLGYADSNPLVSLNLRRSKPAKKPELTDKEIGEIRKSLINRHFSIAIGTYFTYSPNSHVVLVQPEMEDRSLG